MVAVFAAEAEVVRVWGDAAFMAAVLDVAVDAVRFLPLAEVFDEPERPAVVVPAAGCGFGEVGGLFDSA